MSTSTDRPDRKTMPHELGRVIYHFPLLDSTNAYAGRLLSQIRPTHGTIITADYQTAGRGQISRGWHSAPGLNLCMSCILFPEIRPQDQFQISMAVSLAVLDTATDFCPHKIVTIKWPNDIYVGHKKIAGILIQNSIQGNTIASCIAGIGLNVNEGDFPVELPNPTSLKLEAFATLDRNMPKAVEKLSILETGLRIDNSWDLKTVQQRLIEHLSNRINLLGSHRAQLYDDYHAALYLRDIQSNFKLPQKGSMRSGTIEKVDEVGRLVIRWENGEAIAYQHREIEFV